MVPPIIHFTGRHYISHCKYCQCYPGNKYDCHAIDIQGNTKTLCQDCNYITPETRCPYCIDPDNEVTKIESGSVIASFNYLCIGCQCVYGGRLQCDYNNTRQCDDQQSCQTFFKKIKNGTVPYQCKDCLFDEKTRRVGSHWKIVVNDNKNEVRCRCQINGVVDCESENIGEFRFHVKHTNCSSTEIVEDKFKQNGKSNV